MRFLMFILVLSACFSFTCKEPAKLDPPNQISLAFYNLDNLFDTINDTSHDDDDFTPEGKYHWTPERYLSKLKQLNKVITEMVALHPPDILGVCELESALAFNDLMNTNGLKNQYSIVHFDSPDERGIDVALAFNNKKFTKLNAENERVILSRNPNDKTRDILYVKVKSQINNDTFHVIVCHFPSRREGKQVSEQNRIDAGNTVRRILKNKCNNMDRVIIMGDFNDQPWDKSMTQGIGASSISKCPDCFLHNLMFDLPGSEPGSYKYKGHWERLDQIIISNAFFDKKGSEYVDSSVNVVKKEWMLQSGQYKGYPLRTFGGIKWLNGYSDHLPVYIKLNLN